MLRDRFAAACECEPLNALGDSDRAELTALLLRVAEFDELPGRWQAALLTAEAGVEPSGACGVTSADVPLRPGVGNGTLA